MSEPPLSPTPPRALAAPRRGLRAALLGVLGFPWFVHAAVVTLSGIGANSLRGQAMSVAILGAALLVAGAFAFVASFATAAREESRHLGAPSKGLAAVLAAAGATAFTATFALAVTLPVIAYDALAYRLPVIANWLDAGGIAWVTSDDPVRNGYPLGQEAVSAVIAAATGSFRLAGATSFFFVAAGALSIWFLAEECGVRRSLARASGALFLLVPMVILNAPSGYVDAAFAGATVALFCLASLLGEVAPVDPLLAVGAGMAAAHVLALKGNGIAIVSIVAIGVAARAWRTGAPKRRLGTALAFAIPGAFWVIRNIIHTGNPIWPVELHLGAHTLFAGTGTMNQILDVAHNTPARFASLSETGRVVRTWLETSGPAIDFDDRVAGLGWAWPLFALPAILATVVSSLRKESRQARLAPVMFVASLTLACFVMQPMKWWPRYTLWVWGAGALCIGLQAERLTQTGRARLLSLALALGTVVIAGEAGVALVHANGVGAALARGGSLTDPRDAKNASSWVRPEFWHLGVELQKDVCRGAWKPSTDNANLDGVFAQITPRPRVHVVPDDAGSWAEVRRAWQSTGCPELILFPRSPVLPVALQDPSVSIERGVAFDPLFVVRPLKAALVSQLSIPEKP